jgi:hypothetical protein
VRVREADGMMAVSAELADITIRGNTAAAREALTALDTELAGDVVFLTGPSF